MDTEFGMRCSCHPLVKFLLDDGSTVTIKFLRNGKTFAIDYEEGKTREWIYMTPFYNSPLAMSHVKQNLNKTPGVDDEYRKIAIIRDGFSGNLSTLKYEIIKDQYQYYEDKSHEKAGNNQQLVIQKGLLMQEIDSELYDSLKRLKEYLTIGGVSLLDNLIAVSLTSYSDEEVKSLFGFERIKMQYQNGAADLVDAYFALSESSFALIREKQELIEG